jgi:hypothetical protein
MFLNTSIRLPARKNVTAKCGLIDTSRGYVGKGGILVGEKGNDLKSISSALTNCKTAK